MSEHNFLSQKPVPNYIPKESEIIETTFENGEIGFYSKKGKGETK